MQDTRRADARSARGGGRKEGASGRARGAGREGRPDPEVRNTGEPEVREKTRRSIHNWLPSSEVGLLGILLTYKKTALTGL